MKRYQKILKKFSFESYRAYRRQFDFNFLTTLREVRIGSFEFFLIRVGSNLCFFKIPLKKILSGKIDAVVVTFPNEDIAMKKWFAFNFSQKLLRNLFNKNTIFINF